MSEPAEVIRTLIVDDSALVRRLLRRAIGRDGRCEVVGAAPSGASALRLLPDLQPDVVLLDVNMPEMDGFEVLARIRQTHPTLPVLMFSSLTSPGSKASFEAIARGATEVLVKPQGTDEGTRPSLEPVVQKLVEMVQTRRGIDALRGMRPTPPPRPRRSSAARLDTPEIIVLGCSTGGPAALAQLLETLPGELPAPVVVVQHMPPVLTRYLAMRLDKRTSLRVFEASEGDPLEPGSIAIAPGDRHLEVVRRGLQLVAHLTDAPPENSCRPSVDVLFRTAARVCGRHVLAVVLTGMGQDGVAGARELSAQGGRVVVESEETCVVWGMPRAVEEAGLADEILPLPQIGGRLGELALGRV